MLPRELALHQRHHLHKAEPNAANVYHHDAIEQGDRRILDARRGANNCGSASRSTRQTRAPSDTNFRAVARPIPPAATFFTVDAVLRAATAARLGQQADDHSADLVGSPRPAQKFMTHERRATTRKCMPTCELSSPPKYTYNKTKNPSETRARRCVEIVIKSPFQRKICHAV